MSRMIGTLCIAGLLLLSGCESWAKKPPIEEFAAKFVDDVVKPAVEKGIAQGISNLQTQANAQGINPTYKTKFSGKWVVGIEGEASIGVEGVAGNVSVSTSGGEKTERSPYQKESQQTPAPTTEPPPATPPTQPAAANKHRQRARLNGPVAPAELFMIAAVFGQVAEDDCNTLHDVPGSPIPNQGFGQSGLCQPGGTVSASASCDTSAIPDPNAPG